MEKIKHQLKTFGDLWRHAMKLEKKHPKYFNPLASLPSLATDEGHKQYQYLTECLM